MSLEQVLILEHVTHSGGDGDLLPCLESFLGVLNGRVEFVVRRLRHLAYEFLSGLQNLIDNACDTYGIDNVKREGSLGFNPLAVYEVLVLYHFQKIRHCSYWICNINMLRTCPSTYTLREVSLGSLREHRYYQFCLNII